MMMCLLSLFEFKNLFNYSIKNTLYYKLSDRTKDIMSRVVKQVTSLGFEPH
ncbi:hypothetical protein HanRHA438_Chr03g0109041 [Helianthus annuus]|nr:hypothetical protein HanRHA438_Chr03g0109041 [Helianthus annuus]